MILDFTTDTPRFATKHPAHISAGDMFDDLNANGDTVSVLAVRNAKRIRHTPFYRVYGLVLGENRFAGFKVHESRTIQIVGVIASLDITAAPMETPSEGDDPALAERDAAMEALNNPSAFAGDEFLNDEEQTED